MFAMNRLHLMAVTATAACISPWSGLGQVGSGKSRPSDSPEARAVAFLIREVPAWSKNNGCFSCHNNGDAARALYLAARSGYNVPAPTLSDTTAWIREPAEWDKNKGDPGFSDKRLADIQFAASR